MSAWVLAVSAGGVVERFGSYAGYASVLGLGVLALLYFTQAREVKRLREWAGRAPERADDLEQRLQSDPQRRVVAQPIAPATNAAQNAAAASATAALYASIGATAPGSVPPPGQLARPVPPPPGAASPAAPAAPAAAAGTLSPPAGAPSPAAPAAPTAAPAVPSTSSPAGVPTLPSARAAGVAAAARSEPSAPLFGNGSVNQPTRESLAARPAPLPAPPRQPDDEEEYGVSLARIGLIGGGALAVIAIVVVVVLSMTGKSSPPAPNKVGATPATHSPQKSTSGSLASSPSSTALTSAEKRATQVAVLNGTSQDGLAGAVADTVEAKGFTIASRATNADQTIATTTISYTPGNKEAALEVAKLVEVDRSSVQPAAAGTSPVPGADVVVIVGADKSG